MQNGKYVKLDNIIERLYGKIPDTITINKSDIVEWVWEAMSKIAVEFEFYDLYAFLVVEDYKTILPNFLEDIIQVSYVTHDTSLINNETELQNNTRYLMTTALEGFFQDKSNNNLGYEDKGYRYKVRDNYIHTTFEKGIIELYYRAFPVDENFEPMIPQNVYMIEAVTWYIVKELLWRGFMVNDSYEKQYRYADEKWQFYVNSAASSMMIPNEDGMHALVNKYTRILPIGVWRNNTLRRYSSPVITSDQLNNFVLCP